MSECSHPMGTSICFILSGLNLSLEYHRLLSLSAWKHLQYRVTLGKYPNRTHTFAVARYFNRTVDLLKLLTTAHYCFIFLHKVLRDHYLMKENP